MENSPKPQDSPDNQPEQQAKDSKNPEGKGRSSNKEIEALYEEDIENNQGR